MTKEIIAVIVTAVAMVTSTLIFPLALKFARKHDIVDHPNARKLQRLPVPVFGGIVVYAGIFIGGIVLGIFMQSTILLWAIVAMTIMLMIGTWDDMKDISSVLRFFIEIALMGAFIAITGVYVNDLHGLWGVHQLNPWLGVPLSIVLGVGIINAINMIDGVDGYSSGYGIMSCALFTLAFWNVWNAKMECAVLVVMGALIPFFLHNVFGSKSKMFIGDGGTLMLGMVLVVLTFYTLWSGSSTDPLEAKGFSITGFVIALGSIPVFDTLRVMTMRILRGTSPFKPDKTHLHHLFIDMGFSHLGAALSILGMNFLVVVIFVLSWILGASIDVQTYISMGLGVLVTFGFYKFIKMQQNGGPCDDEGYPQGTALWHTMVKLGGFTHREDKRFWKVMRYLVDGPLMGGGKIV